MASAVPLPPHGQYIQAVRESCKAAREKANITISADGIKRLLLSPSFTGTFSRLRAAHGMVLPLNFPSVASELNILSLLSLLNFASGYRVPLHEATGRGAFDSIRAFVFTLFLSDSTGAEGDLLSARGMKSIDEGKVADLMGVADKIHVDKPHETIPGVVVGELGGPVWEVVQMVTKVMNETGDVLVKGGYPDLGSFVLEALKEGEKARKDKDNEGKVDAECDVILERLVRAIPAFQDMALVDREPVYCFKKALLTLHAIALRFGSSPNPSIPVPRTATLPIFSDNVIPSLLIHLGVIDLSSSTPSLGLAQLFPRTDVEHTLEALLAFAPHTPKEHTKAVPKEGPVLSVEQAYTLRAAAIDACELIVSTARHLDANDLQGPNGEDFKWLKDITLPELDAWIWSVAKDRADYRKLPRFVLRKTFRILTGPYTTNDTFSDLRKVLTDSMKHAMKAKDKTKSTAIRSVLSEIYNADKTQPSPVPSSGIVSIIRKAVSRRTEAASEYEKAARPDLAEQERSEADILETFLPPLLSATEVERVLREVIAEVNATPGDKRALGQVFKAFYTKVDRSSVDPDLVKNSANKLLSA
ncbi:hypothetical protein NM688_g6561 [Phlebia brevispora]|uniref:Uncharacterized protein n=1 Tax=Phlebia brevispora TaxID=194682 RepID=A0ACC1SEL1_9APHY|nr:hypothetical protein NM688_g6561 [Phlebia brevispora]